MSSPQVLLRIMLACAPDDQTATRELARRLRLERMQPWLLPDDAPGGVSLERALRSALATMDAVIYCISPATLVASGAQADAFTALSAVELQPRQLTLVLKLADCAVPVALQAAPVIELYAPRGYERLMRALWAHIASLRKTARPSQAAPRPTVAADTVLPSGRVMLPLLQTQQQVERFGRGLASNVCLLDRRYALLTGGGGALLADLAQGEVRWEIDAPTRSACFDHRRHWLALGATGRVSVWDLRSLQLLHEGEADAGPLTALAFHPLEPLLLSASTSGHAILWRLGDKAAQALAVFHAHDAEITSLAFCPDGRYFASAATDRSLRLWRTLDRSVRDELGGTSVVEALAFTPDNQLLLAAARNRSVRVFNVTDGNLLHSVADPHSSAVEALAIASNGELAASGTSNGMCLVWHTQSGQIEAQFQSTPEGVRALSFTPDGTELATLENDQRMRLWSLARGTVHTELALHNTATLAMQFSQNGRQLALGARDGSTTIWALGANQSPLQRFEGQGAPVVGVHFTAHGGALLSVTTAGILRRDLLQEGSGTLARLVGGGTKLVAFSPDGTFLAGSAGDNGVQIWRLSDVWHEGARQPWQTVRNTGQVQSLSFSPDSQILAIVCEDGVRLWQRVDPQAVRAELLVADPGAQRAAIDHGGSLIAWSNTDGRIVLSTLNSGQVLQTVSSGGRGVRSLCFAPDNNRLFAGRQDGRVEIWAINEQASSGGREDRRRSRSGRRLTNLTDLGANVRRAPQLTTTLEAHAAAIEQILLHPSGEAFATTSADGTTRLWRA